VSENGQEPAAPVAVAALHKKVTPAFSSKRSFQATNAVDRMKQYLRDVPVLHKRLNQVVADSEQNLAAAKKAVVEFEAVTAQIKSIVDRWEEEQNHAGPGEPPAPVAAPAASPPVEPGTAG
jgi:hypothetical protein